MVSTIGLSIDVEVGDYMHTSTFCGDVEPLVSVATEYYRKGGVRKSKHLI